MPACRGSMFCSISRCANSSSRRSISRSTSEAGTSNGTRAASCFMRSRAHVAFGGVPRFVLEILAHAGAQRVERLELAQVLRELVVELGQDAAFDPFHRHRIRDVGARQLPDRVVGWIVDVEALGRADLEAEQLLVEPGRIRFRAELDGDVLVRVGFPVGDPLEIDRDRVAVGRRRALRPARSAPRDRAAAAARGRPLRRRRCSTACLSAIVVKSPGSNDGTVSNDAVNVSGWPSSITTSRMSGVSTASTPRSRSASSTARGTRSCSDVVEDLILEALLDDARRRLAGAEAGDARLARVVARDAIDLGVDHVAGEFRRADSCACR